MQERPIKTLYVKDIAENTQIEGLFLVKDKNNGVTKNGKPYIALNLTDKTGEIKARIWDNAEKLGQRFSQGDIVTLKAFSVQYQGALQLNINWIEKHAGDDALLAEFLPASKIDVEAVFAQLQNMCAQLGNKHLRDLTQLIFGNQDIAAAFKIAPAAKSIHHDYLGGLIEHTHSVIMLALAVAKQYPTIDIDLLIAGAMLHDIGKIYEIAYEKNFSYTDQGRLLGHITLGDQMLTDAIRQLPDFPPDLALVIRHLILSHHGQYEFGSPKRPKTPEALLLSYLDDLDAKMYGFTECIRKEKTADSKWTNYNRLFDRYLYTDTYVEAEPPPDRKD